MQLEDVQELVVCVLELLHWEPEICCYALEQLMVLLIVFGRGKRCWDQRLLLLMMRLWWGPVEPPELLLPPLLHKPRELWAKQGQYDMTGMKSLTVHHNPSMGPKRAKYKGPRL